jgi:ribonucleoside-triphosphate reductase
MDIAARSLDMKRKVITRLMNEGLYPYTKRYLGSFDNHFSTIGLVGMNEAIENAKWMHGDITDKEGKDFAVECLNHMRTRLSDYQEAYGDLYNLEATPAESTTYRFAKHDTEEFPDIITAAKHGEAPYYTNSTHLPVGHTDDIFQALEMEDDLQTLYTSGTVFHGFLGERLPDWKSAANLVKKIAVNFKLPYYTMSPTYSVCAEHGYIKGEHFKCPVCGKDAEVYSRITGYYRPVRNWNDGKSSEFKNRKTYVPFGDKVAEVAAADLAEGKAVADEVIDAGAAEAKAEQQAAENTVKAAAMDSEGKAIGAADSEAEKATKQVAQAKAVLLTTKTCPNCNTAKMLLNDAGIDYEVVYAEEDEGAKLASEYNITSAPTLIVPDKDGEKAELYGNVSNIRGYINNKLS